VTAARRVLITGVSHFWGGQLALRLESHPAIEEIVAIDTRGPSVQLRRTDVVHADIRHSLIGKLLDALQIDTVVHTALIVDPQRTSGRVVHETNVIGTMNLLAACAARKSTVRKVVVKTSTAIYGSEPDDPSFWSEDMHRKAPARDGFTRDLDEVEGYIRDFALRKPEAVTTQLRFANVLGAGLDTPFTRLFDLPAVPTVLGFDPRLQFIHELDAVRALEHAVVNDRPGTFNVAGEGIVLLSQAINMLGKPNLPVLPFAGAGTAMFFLNRLLPINFPNHLVRLLQFGRVVDTTALRDRFGLALTNTTPDTVAHFGRERRVREIVRSAKQYTYEADLEAFLRRRTAAGNGRGPTLPETAGERASASAAAPARGQGRARARRGNGRQP
jgi:UDP-glucose 4-epimerase